jgi:hypothetical protein
VNPQLELIRVQAPSWAEVAAQAPEMIATVQVPRPSGRPDSLVTLRIWFAAGMVNVGEQPPRQWPLGCPERHINLDGSFCLGIGDPLSPRSARDADHWWSWLRQFIISQRIADRTRTWPGSRSLHHGDAADHQLKLEQLAAGTTFEREVREALEGGSNWLSGEIPRLTKDGERLVNLRAPCPRGCVLRQHRSGVGQETPHSTEKLR